MELFISGFLLSLSLCLDLGIVNVAIIKTGIEKGFLPSLNIGLGSTLGDMLYAILSLLGITFILKFLAVRWALWIVGTSVLLYFCYTMIVQIFKPHDFSEKDISRLVNNKDLQKYFINGFGLALSSPTAIIWFATVGGSVIATQTLHNKFDLMYFFGGFFSSSITWSFILAFISYKGGQVMKNQIKNVFSVVSAIIFLILAIYLFLDGYKTLIK